MPGEDSRWFAEVFASWAAILLCCAVIVAWRGESTAALAAAGALLLIAAILGGTAVALCIFIVKAESRTTELRGNRADGPVEVDGE